ncbi:Rsp5p-dependent ubiquitination, sorting of cargo proteins at the multivesicular body, partial [Podila humilis]
MPPPLPPPPSPPSPPSRSSRLSLPDSQQDLQDQHPLSLRPQQERQQDQDIPLKDDLSPDKEWPWDTHYQHTSSHPNWNTRPPYNSYRTSTSPPALYRPTTSRGYPPYLPTRPPQPTQIRSSLFPVEYPQYPSPEPGVPESDDEDVTWLVIIFLSFSLIITLSSVIRSCGQKAGWLTGSPATHGSPSSGGEGSSSRRHNRYGRIGYNGSGPQRVPEDNYADPDETEERLAQLSDADRQAYEAAKAFQLVNPPGSVPTDISLSQYLSIQEKGVAAWEFEAAYDQHLLVHDRTELSFYDRVAAVQTNLPLPKQQEVYYWEVKMFEKSPNTNIAIGVSTKPFPTSRLPGWNRHSVGYFSKDGKKYCNSPWSGYPYGPIYFEGDVVGCGYRPRSGTIFFTRNGKRIEEAYTGFKTNLFPTVGATGPCVLHVNFGQSGFVFVEANVKKWGLAPASGSLAPPPAYGSELGSILLEAG